jgi:hypothetical protein
MADVDDGNGSEDAGRTRRLAFVFTPRGKITDRLIGPQGPTPEAQWHQSHRPQQER